MKSTSILLLILVIGINCKKDPLRTVSAGTGSGTGTGSGGSGGGTGGGGGVYQCLVCFSGFNGLTVSYPGFPSNENIYRGALFTGGKFFFAGGLWIGSYEVPDVDMYDAATQTWNNPGSLSLARGFIATSSTANKAIFAGGGGYQSTNTFDRVDLLDINSLSWSQATLSEPRKFIATASLGGKAFFIGGVKAEGFSKKIDVYTEEGDQWSVIEMNEARGSAGAVVVNNKIYIAGGRNSNGNLRRVDIYEPSTGQWTSIEAPNEHPNATVINLGSKIFIAGGDGLNNRSVDIYNTENNLWQTAYLSDSRGSIATGIVKNKIIFIGNGASANVDIYDNTNGQWQTASLSQPVFGVAAASSGSLAIFGGFAWGNTTTNQALFFQ